MLPVRKGRSDVALAREPVFFHSGVAHGVDQCVAMENLVYKVREWKGNMTRSEALDSGPVAIDNKEDT
ncbi:hypothetical protein NDU88_006542 [Pleurodeles waltl]|uniref:Uncharacterized protein n=1 Tax=Pleurodeles waltl TaxID=8319 RepID=A0AAV7MCJ3_PLEWA|nr:hypothetical protein NDU88_006542 [Pleurodeles waltl]